MVVESERSRVSLQIYGQQRQRPGGSARQQPGVPESQSAPADEQSSGRVDSLDVPRVLFGPCARLSGRPAGRARLRHRSPVRRRRVPDRRFSPCLSRCLSPSLSPRRRCLSPRRRCLSPRRRCLSPRLTPCLSPCRSRPRDGGDLHHAVGLSSAEGHRVASGREQSAMGHACLQHMHGRVVQPWAAKDQRRACQIPGRPEPWLVVGALQQCPAAAGTHLGHERDPPEPPGLEADRPVKITAIHDPRARGLGSRHLIEVCPASSGEQLGCPRFILLAAERRHEVINDEAALRASHRGAYRVAVAQRADPDNRLAIRLAWRNDDRGDHRNAGSAADWPPRQRRGRLRHRLECHGCRQHRDPVDLVLGQVRVGAQREPGLAD